MEDKIEIFRSLHKEFLSMLLDDSEEPIELAEVEALGYRSRRRSCSVRRL